MPYTYDYAVIGGDMRQVFLTEKLAIDAKRVCYFALYAVPDKRCFSDGAFVTAASSLEEALSLSACIIGPIPLCGKDACFNQTVLDEHISEERLLSCLKSGQSFFGGCIPAEFRSAADLKGVRIFDLLENPSLSYFNTIATAEGAVCEAIRQSPQNLRKSFCAILGYGKCGRTLLQYLKGMECRTYVAARREEARAQAGILSDYTGTLEEFISHAGEFDFIFNTIPSAVISLETLKKMKPSVTIIDIASAPGGVDFEGARQLGLTARLCPGLPGKYAPVSSAGAIKEIVEKSLKE
ncbi:MAG: dipicolinate synthase subunit DpsA [Eubacteriales bacterium]|nr:dipicolinate synthase subunit DpsA [Eubacteriales bacterium]